MINHPLLFVRRERAPGKQKDVASGSCARHLPKSLLCVSLLLASAAASADNAPLPTQIVDLANEVDGVHPGFRAFHAKGVVVEGSFKASPGAARLSRATLFNGSSIPVTVRFSDGSGIPNVPDGSPAMPRGIAIKYHLPGGTDTDMVTNSFKYFPVGTGEDFRDLLQAIVASPPDAPKPTKLEQFFASHPRPDDRKVVELGVLTLNKVVPNSLEAQKRLLFLPTNLTAGIELSDDPLPTVRTAAYSVSFGRRSQPSSAQVK
jgi:catalase